LFAEFESRKPVAKPGRDLQSKFHLAEFHHAFNFPLPGNFAAAQPVEAGQAARRSGSCRSHRI
jgi:hypothetical protein